jgi:hypothetical protein
MKIIDAIYVIFLSPEHAKWSYDNVPAYLLILKKYQAFLLIWTPKHYLFCSA